MIKNLNKRGFKCYAASVDPEGSAWDRACELYAQLTGTTTDYGEAHSKLHHHQRYGKKYEPLINEWNNKTKVNLIGHSFGGETVRLLAYLMANGDINEKQTSKDNISPLFTGNKGDWIYSVTTLCSPHNGTTLYNIVNSVPKLINSILLFAKTIGNIADITRLDRFYSFNLNQFTENSSFANGTDNAGYDLSPTGANILNNKISTVDNIYYFSYASITTHKVGNVQIPNKNTLLVLIPTSFAMGVYPNNRYSRENDGLVNLNSALHPANEPWTELNADNIQPGIWNVLPTGIGHHGTIIGMDGNTDEIHCFYNNLIDMINNL